MSDTAQLAGKPGPSFLEWLIGRRGWMPLALGMTVALAVVAGNATPASLAVLGLLVALTLFYPIVGVAGLILTAPVFLILSPFIPAGLPFSFLLLVLTLVGLGLRRVFVPRRPPFAWSAIDVAAAFLLVNGLVYVPLAGNLATGVYAFHENLRLFLIYFVIRLLAPGRGSAAALFWSAGLVFFIVLAYGVVQPFWGYETIMHKYGLVERLRDYAGFQKAGVRRAYSLIGSPLSLGMMAMTGTLCGVALLSVPGRRDAAFWAAPWLTAAGVGAAALSYTRSAWVGIAAGLGVAFFLVVRGRARLVFLIVPLLAVWVLLKLVPELSERIGRYALTIVSRDPTETSFHYVALVDAARFFWSHKLGVGLGASSFAGFRFGGGVQMWTENTYLLIGVQMGMQGLVALLVFIGAAARLGWSLFRSETADADTRRLGAAVLLGVSGFAVGGIAHPTLLDVSSMAPLWCLMGLAANWRQDGAAG